MVSASARARAYALAAILGLAGPVASFGAAAAEPGATDRCRIVLVPGAFDAVTAARFLSHEDYFRQYREYFHKMGCEVLQASLAGDAKCEVRALQLKDQVTRWNARSTEVPYVLIAHSQGGLDARFAIRTLGLRPAGLITIGTPHAGTPLAEFVMSRSWSRRLVGVGLRRLGFDLDGLRFPAELTSQFLKRTAPYFAETEGVRYASIQGMCRTQCHWAMRLLAMLKVGDGDGLVPLASQAMGEIIGEFDLDHLSEVGANPKKTTERERLLDALKEKLQLWSEARRK